MKYTQIILKLTAALCVAIILLGLTFLAKPDQAQPAEIQTGQELALQPPAFLKSAHAAGLAQVDFSFIVEEAGITAYTNLNQELDLISLESHFKTIRQQTDQFISGIMTVPGYERITEFDESTEVQVFLLREGWIVSYLTRWQLAAEIFDWVNYDEKRLNDSTLIENVVRMLAADVGVYDFNVSYYDFRYPKANNLMLVAERVDVEHPSDFFDITVPRGLTVHESSWSFGRFGYSYYGSSCALNGEQLGVLNPPASKWGLVTGELTKAQFSPDISHKLSVGIDVHRAEATTQSYCGIAIVYQEAAR